MFMSLSKYAVLITAAALVVACGRTAEEKLPGTLEWDRAAVLVEVSEPIVEVTAAEGQQVEAGQLLLRLDSRRVDAELAVAVAEAQRLEAQLLELRHGARSETVDASRAQLQRAESDAQIALKERDRARSLRPGGMISQADLDRAENTARTTQAAVASARAQLVELLHGTRPEQLAQAEAALQGANANAQLLRLRRERLDVKAPRAGRIDALPFRLGDQPPMGATLVSLLVGNGPYARIYVPERRRVGVQPGQHFRVMVDGVEQPFDATLRSIRSEASFTPYYGLTGDDVSRLTYRAELVLQGNAVGKLPAGLPCKAEQVVDERH